MTNFEQYTEALRFIREAAEAIDQSRAVETAECDDCAHRLSRHGDKHGCEYERGDVPMPCKDGGDVMAAAGPCGCKWGREVA